MANKTDRLSVFVSLMVAGVLFTGGGQWGDSAQQPRQVPTKEQLLKDIDGRLLLIQPGTGLNAGVVFGSDNVFTLTPQDAAAIVKECPAVVAAAPVVRLRTEVSHNKQKWIPLYIYGTTPSYLKIRDWETLAKGRPFSEQEVRDGSTVCLLGATPTQELFGKESPVGKEVRVGNVKLKVLGVLSKKGANRMGLDQDDIVLAPWTTIKFRVSGATLPKVNQSAATTTTTDPAQAVNSLSKVYPGISGGLYPTPSATQAADTPLPVRFTNVDQILTQARSVKDVEAAVRQVRELLRQRHNIAAGQPDDFSIRDMRELLKALSGPRP
jgi:hypothetical protein